MDKPTIFVTRPADRGEALAQALLSHGYEAVMQPMISVVPSELADRVARTGDAVPDVIEQVHRSGHSLLLLFTSIYAVRYFFAESHEPFREEIQKLPDQFIRYLAIGPATQAALAKHGVSAELAPAHNSESAIELLRNYSSVFGLTLGGVLLVKGAGGRTLMSEWLQTNHIPYQEWVVYHREAIQELSPLTISAYQQAESCSSLVVFTSVEAMELWAHWCDRYDWHLPAVVVCSQRMLETASRLGMSVAALASGCDNDALLEAIRGVN